MLSAAFCAHRAAYVGAGFWSHEIPVRLNGGSSTTWRGYGTGLSSCLPIYLSATRRYCTLTFSSMTNRVPCTCLRCFKKPLLYRLVSKDLNRRHLLTYGASHLTPPSELQKLGIQVQARSDRPSRSVRLGIVNAPAGAEEALVKDGSVEEQLDRIEDAQDGGPLYELLDREEEGDLLDAGQASSSRASCIGSGNERDTLSIFIRIKDREVVFCLHNGDTKKPCDTSATKILIKCPVQNVSLV